MPTLQHCAVRVDVVTCNGQVRSGCKSPHTSDAILCSYLLCMLLLLQSTCSASPGLNSRCFAPRIIYDSHEVWRVRNAKALRRRSQYFLAYALSVHPRLSPGAKDSSLSKHSSSTWKDSASIGAFVFHKSSCLAVLGYHRSL